jgi:predicted small metal-binding protein
VSDRRIRTRCACGWEASGPEDEVVEATIEHGQRLHNMVATRDQVLSQAEEVEVAEEVEAAKADVEAKGAVEAEADAGPR